MNNKVPVTYSNRTGWTVGVAEAIGKTLIKNGVLADVIPMREVKGHSVYDPVMAGSAIQNKTWLPEAVQSIRIHQDELKRKPCATF